MKKFINLAFIYAILAMVGGVFYREFTKFVGFTGKTTLAFVHLHYFVLGVVIFLILAIFSNFTDLENSKKLKPFMITYNIGLNFMIVMFIVKGITQALEIEMTKTTLAMISGFAGIAHITLGVGIILLFLMLKSIKSTKKADL